MGIFFVSMLSVSGLYSSIYRISEAPTMVFLIIPVDTLTCHRSEKTIDFISDLSIVFSTTDTTGTSSSLIYETVSRDENNSFAFSFERGFLVVASKAGTFPDTTFEIIELTNTFQV